MIGVLDKPSGGRLEFRASYAGENCALVVADSLASAFRDVTLLLFNSRSFGALWCLLALGAPLADAQEAADSETGASSRAPFRFVDVTADSGLTSFKGIQGSEKKDHIIEVMGGGAAFLDYDADGNLDILLVRGSTIEEYRQGGSPVCALFRGDGQGHFQDVTEESGLTKRGWGQGVAVADYDNDGNVDIFVTGYGGNFLFRNLGGGKFEEVGARAGVSETRWSLGAAFTDVDRDGHLDLYVANYLDYPLDRIPQRDASCNYRGFAVFCGPRGLPGLRDSLFLNDGKGGFRDVAVERDIDPEKLYGLGVLAADYDNDGWPDIFVANDLTANLFYRNLGKGGFEEIGIFNGSAFSQDGIEEGSMGIDIADFNQDGWLDIYYTNSSYESNSLLVNNGDGSFTNLTNMTGHGQSTYLYVGWGVSSGDLDNDGREDLFVVNGHLYPEADRFEMGLSYKQRPLLFLNVDGKRFVERGEDAGLTTDEKSRGLALGDYDNDGDLDAVINNLDGPPTLLRNDGGNRNRWLIVQCRGTKANRSAVGARVEAIVGDEKHIREVRSGSSYLSHSDLRLHFGLGSHKQVDELKIRWPSGTEQVLRSVATNQVLVVEEGREGALSGGGIPKN